MLKNCVHSARLLVRRTADHVKSSFEREMKWVA